MNAWETHFNEIQLKEIQDCRTNAATLDDNESESYIIIIAKMAHLLDMGVVPYILKKVDMKQPVIPNKPKSGA